MGQNDGRYVPVQIEDFHPITKENMTGLQPVSRLVERVHYFGGWFKTCVSQVTITKVLQDE